MIASNASHTFSPGPMPDDNWTPEYQDGEPVPGTPYRVVSLLGAGGMGSVYIVEHV